MVIQFAAESEDGKETKTKQSLQRRVTKAVIAATMPVASSKKIMKQFKQTQKWWQKASINYAFSHPHVTSRLERLMGSNLVCLTDRDYMQKLQERIIEDYAESMNKRIKVREITEMERVKNLVLSGKIPLHDAPDCMANHPIMLIERHCRALIAARRAKIKIPKVHIPRHLYFDDTPDPPSGLSIENGHIFRSATDRLCTPVSRFLPIEELSVEEAPEETMDEGEQIENYVDEMEDEEEEGAEDEEEEIDVPLDEYMFTKEEYDKLKYESPLIKRLRRCKTVDKMYALADEIIGVEIAEEILDKSANLDLSSEVSSVRQ